MSFYLISQQCYMLDLGPYCRLISARGVYRVVVECTLYTIVCTPWYVHHGMSLLSQCVSAVRCRGAASSMLSLLIVPALLASGQVCWNYFILFLYKINFFKVNAQFGQPTNANPFVDQVAIPVKLGVHLILIFY